MLKNYILLAFRNLAKHRFFSLLNILGLALGMSACLTVILIIRDQLSFDHFHPNAARVFRVNCQQPDGFKMATVPFPLAETLSKDFSVAEESVSLVRSIYNVDATTAENQTLQVGGFFTETSFFKVFGFQLEAGNAANVLDEPNSLVLSKNMAERFFGNKNPIGETLDLKNKGIFKITGVVATPPGKTHLEFDCLASAASLPAMDAALKPEEYQEKITGNWENRYMTYVYVLLRPGQTKSDLENALAVVAEKREKANAPEKNVRFFAQNLGNISPKPEQYANELGASAPMFFIWGLIAFVLILTIFPCLNYSNMAISQALARTREMGVRKAIGAQNSDVKRLILTEGVVTAFIALGLAWVLHLPLNHFVGTFFPPQTKLTNLHAEGLDWLIFIVFGLAVGLLAGWIPARRMAKLHPAIALRGNKSGEILEKNKIGWRKIMLVGQFSLSLILMIVVATLWSQLQFMTLADYGFQKENLLTVELQGNKPGIVAAEMAQDPHVTGVCMTSVVVASNNLQGVPIFRERGGEKIDTHGAMVDENYLPVMGLKLVAGENFAKNPLSTRDQFLILNEKAVEHFQLGSRAEAIGKVLWMNDSTPVSVRGVVRDFHYRILDHAIEPFAFRYSPTEKGYIMHLRIAPGNPSLAMASLGSIWKKMDAVHPFKATFMEESMQKAYGHVTFVGGLASFFALLALSIACLGLLGSVTYSIGSKVKEIGIRKILGASAAQVTLKLAQHFLILLAVAVAIAVPVGYFLANIFLELFAYRIAVGGLILAGSAAFLLFLGLITIGVQAGRAALANPVEALRSE